MIKLLFWWSLSMFSPLSCRRLRPDRRRRRSRVRGRFLIRFEQKGLSRCRMRAKSTKIAANDTLGKRANAFTAADSKELHPPIRDTQSCPRGYPTQRQQQKQQRHRTADAYMRFYIVFACIRIVTRKIRILMDQIANLIEPVKQASFHPEF